ncbi:unnamed protein product [Medioppia subpectinata]|uniref:Uncharacterized protein n=1 Tax=Medioppia subpectinata TaxID=1979941 RepID=A0A7R9KZ41_9ACAR|nr:unnamed protein product [Medioppia subpectinata]CAG2112552.1 unnamed protein product [Medioppia subpectinata]
MVINAIPMPCLPLLCLLLPLLPTLWMTSLAGAAAIPAANTGGHKLCQNTVYDIRDGFMLTFQNEILWVAESRAGGQPLLIEKKYVDDYFPAIRAPVAGAVLTNDQHGRCYATYQCLSLYILAGNLLYTYDWYHIWHIVRRDSRPIDPQSMLSTGGQRVYPLSLFDSHQCPQDMPEMPPAIMAWDRDQMAQHSDVVESLQTYDHHRRNVDDPDHFFRDTTGQPTGANVTVATVWATTGSFAPTPAPPPTTAPTISDNVTTAGNETIANQTAPIVMDVSAGTNRTDTTFETTIQTIADITNDVDTTSTATIDNTLLTYAIPTDPTPTDWTAIGSTTPDPLTTAANTTPVVATSAEPMNADNTSTARVTEDISTTSPTDTTTITKPVENLPPIKIISTDKTSTTPTTITDIDNTSTDISSESTVATDPMTSTEPIVPIVIDSVVLRSTKPKVYPAHIMKVSIDANPTATTGQAVNTNPTTGPTVVDSLASTDANPTTTTDKPDITKPTNTTDQTMAKTVADTPEPDANHTVSAYRTLRADDHKSNTTLATMTTTTTTGSEVTESMPTVEPQKNVSKRSSMAPYVAYGLIVVGGAILAAGVVHYRHKGYYALH